MSHAGEYPTVTEQLLDEVVRQVRLAGDSDIHELVGRSNRRAHPLSEPRGGLRPSFSR